MNKKYYVFGAVFALLLSGLFSSCVVIAAEDEELYNFEFVSDHILECNYTGYITEDNIESVKIYDNRGSYKYSSTVTSTSCKNSRVTFILDRNLRGGWYVEIKFRDNFSRETYKVYYNQ
ncbi:hypothetical protein [Treponema sp.]|uniref:hypothetical protein n=1 Tax=Treponema sp. TaxID=166 RepID=UPI00388F2E00